MSKRIKATAATAPQTLAEAQQAIKVIGDIQRDHARLSADLNDAVANITEAAAPELKRMQDQITLLQKSVQMYCESNRELLCGKAKTANLVTGEVSWRQRPPSIKITGAEAVLAWLNEKHLTSFIRTKTEINKEAMLNEPDKAKAVPGVTLVTGIEDFVITPYEVNTELAS